MPADNIRVFSSEAFDETSANSKELTFTTRLRLTSNSLVATKCKVTREQRDDSTIFKEASSEL